MNKFTTVLVIGTAILVLAFLAAQGVVYSLPRSGCLEVLTHPQIVGETVYFRVSKDQIQSIAVVFFGDGTMPFMASPLTGEVGHAYSSPGERTAKALAFGPDKVVACDVVLTVEK